MFSTPDRPPGSCTQGVYAEHPGCADVAALYAEAVMNFAPWRLWDLDTVTGEGCDGHNSVLLFYCTLRTTLLLLILTPG